MKLRQFINSKFSMKAALENIGVKVSTNMFCPFHDDIIGGHKSAKYHADTDSIFCFSCHRSFYTYDVLVDLCNISVSDLYGYSISQGWNPDEQGLQVLQSQHGQMKTRIIFDEHVFLNFKLSLITAEELFIHLRSKLRTKE